MRLSSIALVISLLWAGAALAQDLAFITSEQTGGTVNVVNVFNNNIVKTIPVGNRFDGNVSVIDTVRLEVVDTVFVGDQPFGVAVSPDSSLVYVITIRL